ncbi:MAG: DUF5320 domain-containing protein [Candidatus Dojkabacteria bacterium]|jgi:hypothetical protein
MPNFDKTGPRGEGPKTGLGRGDCQKSSDNGSKDSLSVRGNLGTGLRNRLNCLRLRIGRRRGGGRRFNNRQIDNNS